MRVLEATSDLHSADAQYHKDRYGNFMTIRNTQAAQWKCNVKGEQDHGFQSAIEVMNSDKKHMNFNCPGNS